ncbi:uncharacterized protein LOC124351124 [Daphnia pulicaria]|uniref:uncharacterized protein LOC124351124 n=1 Tax=Daphnia pulicaria TaxID=35523 RepID=UPI001EEBDC14|nr:uncharacterized protein LOC124351124 [Daphnia pulicaria]
MDMYATSGVQGDMPIDRVLDAEKRVECKDETQGNSATLRNNLEDISRNLNESRVDSHKDARSRKKQEIVEDLKCRLQSKLYQMPTYSPTLQHPRRSSISPRSRIHCQAPNGSDNF